MSTTFILPRYKISLLTANVGMGHKSIHHAILMKLQEIFHDYPVDISELEINAHLNWLGRFLFYLYTLCVEWFPLFYHYFYKLTNKVSVQRFVNWHYWLLSEDLRYTLGVLNPDLVINTHPSGAALCSLLKQEGYVSPKCNFIMFDTDFATGTAYNSEGILVVPHQKLKDEMIKQHLRNQDNVEVIPGLLPRPEFCQEYSQTESRLIIQEEIYQETGIEFSLVSPLFLAVGGGEGLRLKKLINFLPNWEPTQPITVLIICGKKKRLLRKTQKIIRQGLHFNLTVIALGYKKNIHLYMKAADILISKPGGATIAETMALGLPLFVHDLIEGQERLNLNFLLPLKVLYYLHEMTELNDISRILTIAGLIKRSQQLEFPDRKIAINHLSELFWKVYNNYPRRATTLSQNLGNLLKE